ncbi:hypothetical protein D3C83_123900 [compost metagenome]
MFVLDDGQFDRQHHELEIFGQFWKKLLQFHNVLFRGQDHANAAFLRRPDDLVDILR